MAHWQLLCYFFHVVKKKNKTLPKRKKPLPNKISSNSLVLSNTSSYLNFPGCLSQSDQFSCSVVSDSLQPHELQHARPPCPSPTPGVYENSCPLSWWCHSTISSTVVPFSPCPQSFPASGSFQMSVFYVDFFELNPNKVVLSFKPVSFWLSIMERFKYLLTERNIMKQVSISNYQLISTFKNCV